MWCSILGLFCSDPLEDYRYDWEAVVHRCTIQIMVGHYTATPHKIGTAMCAGVTLHSCHPGGGTYDPPGLGPPFEVTPKEITPFPGAHPLRTDVFQFDNAVHAAKVLEDFEAAKAYAATLCQTGECYCYCEKITVKITFWGLTADQKNMLYANGVTEKTETVSCD
jgi:hypothetical protein